MVKIIKIFLIHAIDLITRVEHIHVIKCLISNRRPVSVTSQVVIVTSVTHSIHEVL